MTHSASSADQNGERPTHRPRMRPLNRQATSRIARLSLSSNSLSLMVLVDGDISSGSAAILPSGPSHSCQLSKCKCTWELVDRVARSWPHQSHSHAVRVSHTDTCNRVRHVPGVLKRVFCSGTCVLPLTQRHDAVICSQRCFMVTWHNACFAACPIPVWHVCLGLHAVLLDVVTRGQSWPRVPQLLGVSSPSRTIRFVHS
jgi:hypothetical protein